MKDSKQATFLLGPPGAGKGTQAKLLAEKLNAIHIGSGDVVRQKIQQPGQEKLKKIYNKGQLLPSEIILQWGKEEVKKIKNKDIIFEGWTRNVEEAKTMEKLVQERGYQTKVLNIWISPKETMKRNLKRGREDDTRETIKKRLEVYKQETAPVLDYFDDKVIKIDGEQSIQQVHQDILKYFSNEQKKDSKNPPSQPDSIQDNKQGCPQNCPGCSHGRT